MTCIFWGISFRRGIVRKQVKFKLKCRCLLMMERTLILREERAARICLHGVDSREIVQGVLVSLLRQDEGMLCAMAGIVVLSKQLSV